MNHINPKQDVFFHETSLHDPDLSQIHMKPIIDLHVSEGSWTNGNNWRNREVIRLRKDTGEYQMITRVYNFVSVARAVKFFKDIIADGTEYRRLKRKWHQENGILNETNVLDQTGNIVEVIHACQAHKCIRFGSCPSVGSGCATVPAHTHDGIYPIYHINSITSK